VARLALFDLDGTLTRGDTYRWFVAQLLLRHPARWPRALLLPFPLLACALRRIDRGELKGAILRLLFAGLSRAHITRFAQQFAARVTPARMFPAAVAALQGHLKEGDHVVLLSASPDLFVPEIGRLLGVHETRCTPIRWQQDHLDGRLAGPNHRDAEKARVLAGLRTAHPGLPVIAYGNSTPDLDHMRLCEQAVFVNAPPALAGRLAAEFPAMQLVRWR
jgi:phosphatidylglycerophosphatase C